MGSCPTCGQSLPEPDRPALEQDLRAWCAANGHHVTADGAVYEDVAAHLIDRAPGTLANWRTNGGAGVPFFRSGRTGRVRYRLADLAAYLERQRHD